MAIHSTAYSEETLIEKPEAVGVPLRP